MEAGRADGILVYRGAQPVGWCQFGRRDDLPRVEHGRKYRALATGLGGPPNWRITCFFVDKPLRRTGIAQFALHAALEAIRRRGGGVVEGYPATHGRAVAMWFGTVAMFEREGFTAVRSYGRSNVLVRREIRAAGGTRGTGAARKTGARRRSTDERGRSGAHPPGRPRR